MKIGDIFSDGVRTYECIGEANGYPVCKLIEPTKEVKEEKVEAPKRRTRKE